MYLKDNYINIILNILLGAAWAAVLYGFFSGFNSLDANIFIKLINALIYSMFGLFLVLLVEVVYRFFKNHEILKKQLEILEELQKVD